MDDNFCLIDAAHPSLQSVLLWLDLSDQYAHQANIVDEEEDEDQA